MNYFGALWGGAPWWFWCNEIRQALFGKTKNCPLMQLIFLSVALHISTLSIGQFYLIKPLSTYCGAWNSNLESSSFKIQQILFRGQIPGEWWPSAHPMITTTLQHFSLKILWVHMPWVRIDRCAANTKCVFLTQIPAHQSTTRRLLKLYNQNRECKLVKESHQRVAPDPRCENTQHTMCREMHNAVPARLSHSQLTHKFEFTQAADTDRTGVYTHRHNGSWLSWKRLAK